MTSCREVVWYHVETFPDNVRSYDDVALGNTEWLLVEVDCPVVETGERSVPG